jgi:hypothetical protein
MFDASSTGDSPIKGILVPGKVCCGCAKQEMGLSSEGTPNAVIRELRKAPEMIAKAACDEQVCLIQRDIVIHPIMRRRRRRLVGAYAQI